MTVHALPDHWDNCPLPVFSHKLLTLRSSPVGAVVERINRPVLPDKVSRSAAAALADACAEFAADCALSAAA